MNFSHQSKIKKTTKQKEVQNMCIKVTLQSVRILLQMGFKILKICI